MLGGEKGWRRSRWEAGFDCGAEPDGGRSCLEADGTGEGRKEAPLTGLFSSRGAESDGE